MCRVKTRHIAAYYTTKKPHIPLKSSSKTLILRPFEAVAARTETANILQLAVYLRRVSALRGTIHRRERPQLADLGRSSSESSDCEPDGREIESLRARQ